MMGSRPRPTSAVVGSRPRPTSSVRPTKPIRSRSRSPLRLPQAPSVKSASPSPAPSRSPIPELRQRLARHEGSQRNTQPHAPAPSASPAPAPAAAPFARPSRSPPRSPQSASPSPARSRSPIPEMRQRLARHEGSQRNTQPAWMTRGIGVNKEMFGETRGDLIKPGLTQADLDDLEKKVQHRSSSPDLLGDFFESRRDVPEPSYQRARQSRYDSPERDRQGARHSDEYTQRNGRQRQQAVDKPSKDNTEADGSGDCEETLIDLARDALSAGGFMQGHRLGVILIKKHRDLVEKTKVKFGAKGWMMKMLLESTTDVKIANLPEHGGPCFYIDSEDNGRVPAHPAPPSIALGERIPETGNAKALRQQGKNKRKTFDESPEPERCTELTVGRSAPRAECSPEPELHAEPKDGGRVGAVFSPERERHVEPKDGRSAPSERVERKDPAPAFTSVWKLLG